MAIFHLNAKVISRGSGQSAIAAAAYRSGEKLRDEQTDEQKFYTTRSQRILSADIMAPKDAPEWAHDRGRLWNEAERAERRVDSQLAREIEIALPHELTAQQREWLVKDFAREQFVRRGYVVDYAIHAADKGSDCRNFHAHLMISMRTLGPEGFADKKDRSLNGKEQLWQWREEWAHLANRHLERHGHEARIDHRTLEAQGIIDREPGVHVGYVGYEMTRRGVPSERMDALRDVVDRNEIRMDLKAIDRELAVLNAERQWEIIAARQAQQAAEMARVAQEARVAAQAAVAAAAATKERQRKDAEASKLQDQAARRVEAQKQLQQAAKADEKTLRTDVARSFGDGARYAAREIRNDRQVEVFWAQQTAWKKNVSENAPAAGTPKQNDSGLKVVDGATGVVSKLGDFMVGLLAGPTAAPTPDPQGRPDMKAFFNDPNARKQQQLERLEMGRQVQADEKALESMRRDMEAGQGLKADDIKNLTPAHQMQIHMRGDDAVRQLIDEAQKRSEERDGGRERD